MSPSAASSRPPANVDNVPADVPAKISAYYSLVFPNITFFLQTLTVTIGRRCLPSSVSINGTDSTPSSHNPVDVDLGPLKSVSRLHARIEYEEEEARFMLVVIGRNGAWVDGVWSGAGSRVPLGERSQIQIASRTFHFVLPPPAAVENSPSPSSTSSVQRVRSPSVDITSISPPSSLPSHSPSPRVAPSFPPPKPPRSPNHQLPNSNAIPRTKTASTSTSTPLSGAAPTSKKRKKAPPPLPKPDVMPPKPPFTYAQLCYQAIKAMGGKATLQDICGWMMDNYDWYRYNEGAGWENSIRHNLSSGRAFKKMERSTGEHGKGFFWSVDTQYEHIFEEQEARAAAQSQSTSSLAISSKAKDSAIKNSRRKDKAAPLDPPLKRSVKSGAGPLPPPLTSTPLALSRKPVSDCTVQVPLLGQVGLVHMQTTGGSPATPTGGPLTTVSSVASSESSSTLASGVATPANFSTRIGISGPRPCEPSSSTVSNDHSSSVSTSPFTALPPSVCLPIVIGPVPPSHPSSSTVDPPPIVLHNNTLVLSPTIFSSLTPEQVKALEEMGAQKALEVLQGHIVRYLKERMGKKKRKKVAASGLSEKGDTKAAKTVLEQSGPFTTVPLPSRTAQVTPISQVLHSHSKISTSETSATYLSNFRTSVNECSAVDSKEDSSYSIAPVPVPVLGESDSQTLAIVIRDGDDEDGRVTKKRRLTNGVEMGTELKLEASAVQLSLTVDEDIEVDVC